MRRRRQATITICLQHRASEYLPIELDELEPDDVRDPPIASIRDFYDFEFGTRPSSRRAQRFDNIDQVPVTLKT